MLGGDDDETTVRTLTDPQRPILQRSGVDAFIMAVPRYASRRRRRMLMCACVCCRSLGALNYLRIWHDNSGASEKASWFLKYVVIRDLQTMSKSHFICQRWLAVEKEDRAVSSSLFVVWNLCAHARGNWDRSSVCCRWRETMKRCSLGMRCRNKRTTACRMGTCGFQSLPGRRRASSLACSGAHAVSSCCSSTCFSISCITIVSKKPKQRKRLVASPSGLFTSVPSRCVSVFSVGSDETTVFLSGRDWCGGRNYVIHSQFAAGATLSTDRITHF